MLKLNANDDFSAYAQSEHGPSRSGVDDFSGVGEFIVGYSF
jgi:hypothetical protein